MRGKHILVCGKVQGVGYRYFAKIQADLLGISGWVKNLDNGCVEITALGGERTLEAYIAKLKLGPPRSKVDNLDVREVEISEFKPHNDSDGAGFEILK